jgi:hypothetical protein
VTDHVEVEVENATGKAEREYPTFGPADDDFHDEVLSDRWWETETSWFSWNVPERRMGGWVYCQARPNANLCNGGAWVWDDKGSYSWELPYHAHYTGLRLPERSERDMRDFAWPNGVHITAVEPLMTYRIRYEDPGALEVDLLFEGIMAPNAHPVGVAPFIRGTHFDQPGRVAGQMILHGEAIPVDCFSTRDRSWGPRPMGRPKKPGAQSTEALTRSGGIGYSFGTADASNAWLVYSIPGPTADPVSCGFLLRDGHYGHVLAGERRLRVDPLTGWPTRMEIELSDDLGRHLHVRGEAVSRHWRGLGGDTLFRWSWDDVEGWGEDQSYFSRPAFEANRSRS